MTRVLIVGKTKMKSRRCIGALGVNDNKSYRLQTIIGDSFPSNTVFNLGQVWDIDFEKESGLAPPHTEDVRILSQRRVQTLSMSELTRFLLDCVTAPVVSPQKLFDGCLRFTLRRKALIYRYGRIPQRSTGFWRLDKALHKRLDDNGKVRYLYCEDDISCDYSDEDLVLDVPYVGCEAPLEKISRGTLLRFSLSGDYSAGKYYGYWLQLSGWFLDDSLPAEKKSN